MENLGPMGYDQSNQRTEHPPQSIPIQDAVLGQAQLDQDGLGSMQSVNDARQPDDIAPSVYGQQTQPTTTQGRYNHQDNRQITPRIVQSACSSSSLHTDFHSQESSQQAVGNSQPLLGNSSTYAQSVSGFSSYGINQPSGGHLQLLDNVELPSLSNSCVADPHAVSTHEALTRGLRACMGESVYTGLWKFCYDMMISAGHDHTTAEGFANNLLYYPDSSIPVLKCAQCQHEHDDRRPFEHAATCIVQQCLTTITTNELGNIQIISPRQRPAEGVKKTQSRSKHLDLKDKVQKENACRQRSDEVHVRAECLNQQTPAPSDMSTLDQQTPAPSDMSTLDNEYHTATLIPVAQRDHSVPREQIYQAGTIRTENTIQKSLVPAGHKKIDNPLYAVRQNRIRSFDNWPTSSKQQPKRLAKAGFYYTGTSDHCRCFYCGGLLRDWEDNDDPMTEHKHWFQDCPFVMDTESMDCNTGTATDQDVTNIKERKQSTIDQTVLHGVANISLQERDVTGSDTFQTLVNMGFAREDVLYAAQSVGRRAQHAYSIDELFTILLQKQTSATGSGTPNIPPAMDVKICGVCDTNEIAVTQYHCGHIVCRKCMARMYHEGNHRCGICGKKVTKVVAIDSSAFNN